MARADTDDCFDRKVALQDDWINGRIPMCAASFELLAAQAELNQAGLSPSVAARLGMSVVEVWADSEPPLRSGGLSDIGGEDRSAIDRLRFTGGSQFAQWIVRQTLDSAEPLHSTATDQGVSLFLSVAMLAVAAIGSNPGQSVTGEEFDHHLPLSASWAILLLAMHRQRVGAGTLLEVAKHLRNQATAEKKNAVWHRLDKYAAVQQKAAKLARDGNFTSVRKAADAVLPKIRREALAVDWFKTGSSRDSNLNTLYGYLRKIPDIKKAGKPIK